MLRDGQISGLVSINLHVLNLDELLQIFLAELLLLHNILIQLNLNRNLPVIFVCEHLQCLLNVQWQLDLA